METTKKVYKLVQHLIDMNCVLVKINNSYHFLLDGYNLSVGTSVVSLNGNYICNSSPSPFDKSTNDLDYDIRILVEKYYYRKCDFKNFENKIFKKVRKEKIKRINEEK